MLRAMCGEHSAPSTAAKRFQIRICDILGSARRWGLSSCECRCETDAGGTVRPLAASRCRTRQPCEVSRPICSEVVVNHPSLARLIAVGIFGLFVVSVGCSKGPAQGTVRGTVTLDGK